MKKSLFGYNISEADITLNALREENESLNASIIALKTQIKNSASEENGKISLLENVNMKNKEALKNAADEKRSLLSQIAVLSKDVEELRKENETLRAEMAAGAQAVEVRAADKGLDVELQHPASNQQPVSSVISSAKASVPSKQRQKLKNVPGSGSEGQQGKFVSAVLKDIAGVSKKITREGQNIAKSIKRTPPK